MAVYNAAMVTVRERLQQLLRRRASAAAGPLDPPAVGPDVAHYRLQALIARGAHSELYAVTDLRDGSRRALKRLHLPGDIESAAASAALRSRFVQEAGTASRLRHPHIVEVLDAGEWQGRAYLVMELLTGRDLGAYTRRSRLLPEPVVLRVVAALADALDHAHRQGVVHRDLKPANVVLDLPRHQVKLTDFGIARSLEAERTRSGLFLGTPTYMAPEQLAGAPAGTQGDFYALGAVLFELLTGRPPHVAANLGELLRAIAAQAAPDLRRLRPELPGGLADLVAELLQRDPRRRLADGPAIVGRLSDIEAQWPRPAAVPEPVKNDGSDAPVPPGQPEVPGHNGPQTGPARLS